MIPSIGDYVSYVRVLANGDVVDGHGFVTAIVLDVSARIQVRVSEEKDNYNIDLIAINADSDTRAAYIAHVNKIRAHADAINTQIKELAKNGNEDIEKMNDEFLGKRIVLTK